MFLTTSTGLNFKDLLKIWVCYYHISLSPVKVKVSSLLIHRTNPRHDSLDLTQSEISKNYFNCQRFCKQRCFRQLANAVLLAVL